MRLLSFIQKLHERSPRLGEAVSFLTATTVITGTGLAAGIPIWLMGATKVLTGSQVADKGLISMTTSWLNNNNALINNILPTKDWRISLPDDVQPNGKYLLVSTINHGLILV